MDKDNLPIMLTELIKISKNAGEIILTHYNNSEQDVEYKDDDSPLTKADLESDAYIGKSLKKLYNIPIISEENYPEYNVRKDYTEFFLVDPLDGTKEFIERNGEFTVNIAYVKSNKPVMGVIYAPVPEITYFAAENYGSYMEDETGRKKLPLNEPDGTVFTATGSRKHSTALDSEFMQMNNIQNIVPAGSSLKFCKVAAGLADIYPRFQGSMEWDIAAGHIIAKEAGCSLIDLKTRKEPDYNKESLLNNYFLALKKGIEIQSIKIPDIM
ncbi:MAG: 3'(2'),5'-bisphosphate nucleotidase CysQ [Methanomicrobiaceae archaeon]|nr:3'(2'),5'-bisphosphate nucleotidase CysQ [Methanomicrobiaceae archaeon]